MEIKKIDLDQIDDTSTASLSKANKKVIDSVQNPKTNMSDTYKLNLPTQIAILAIIALLGGVTGSWIKSLQGNTSSSTKTASGVSVKAAVPETGAKIGDIYGSPNETGFKDSATGVVDKGGSANGEGTHKLVRPGGVSQTVYLSSSVIDLDQLVGHQVTVWGETNKGQKVGWLMDVGRAKVENLNVPLPK